MIKSLYFVVCNSFNLLFILTFIQPYYHLSSIIHHLYSYATQQATALYTNSTASACTAALWLSLKKAIYSTSTPNAMPAGTIQMALQFTTSFRVYACFTYPESNVPIHMPMP